MDRKEIRIKVLEAEVLELSFAVSELLEHNCQNSGLNWHGDFININKKIHEENTNKMTNTMQERFKEQFVEMHPMYGQDLHNPPLLYQAPDEIIAELLSFIQSEKDLSKKEGQEEYKQFILNIFDGVDIADGECNTKAIRLAINSRVT